MQSHWPKYTDPSVMPMTVSISRKDIARVRNVQIKSVLDKFFGALTKKEKKQLGKRGEIILGVIGLVFLAGWIAARIQLSRTMKEGSAPASEWSNLVRNR